MSGFGFSFEDLLGGGFPGGGGGRHHHHDDSDEEEVDTESYYKLLGINKKATQDEIKKAYKKQARKVHPDRHPDEKDKYQSLFQDLQKAFETLKDPHKRQLYDKYGEKGVKRGHAPFKGGMGGLFEQMFSDSRQRDRGPKKSPAIKRVMHIALEDSYSGKLIVLKIGKHVARNDGKPGTCDRCNGKGKITVTQRRGPMIFQSTKGCSQCSGMGYKLATKEVDLDINIPIGIKDGESYTKQGCGHEYPDHEPGDVIIQFKIKKHKVFTRQGADLGMNHTISFREALCGYLIRVRHVSGKNIVITSQDYDEIVQPGSLKRVMSMGMPQRYAPHVKGHLYIVMEVTMPRYKELNNKTMTTLKRMLPNKLPEKFANKHTNIDDDDESKEPDNNNNNNNKSKQKKQKKKRQNGGDFGANLFGGLNKKKKKSKKNENMDIDNDDIYDKDYVETVVAEPCEDNPKATPASATHEYDDDDQNEGVQCKQM